MNMNSNKPYLLRAVYEWILDNNVTPHIVIHADYPETHVPLQYVEDGKIVLNISPTAAQNLLIDNEGVSFNARFAGKPFSIYAPIGAVLALYANENGEGMMFELENIDDSGSPDTHSKETAPALKTVDKPRKGSQKKKKSSKKPSLKIVK